MRYDGDEAVINCVNVTTEPLTYGFRSTKTILSRASIKIGVVHQYRSRSTIKKTPKKSHPFENLRNKSGYVFRKK